MQITQQTQILHRQVYFNTLVNIPELKSGFFSVFSSNSIAALWW